MGAPFDLSEDNEAHKSDGMKVQADLQLHCLHMSEGPFLFGKSNFFKSKQYNYGL